MHRTSTAILLLLAAACGGSAEPAPAQPTPPEAKEPAGEDHHPEFPDSVTAFHDALRPLWHAEPGPKRVEDTCAAVETLEAEAGPMHDGTPVAEERSQEWFQAVSALKTAIVELGYACEEEGRPDFEAAFSKVHDEFHKVAAFFQK